MPDRDKTSAEPTIPVDVEVIIDGQPQRLRYDQAFALGCSLMEHGQAGNAAKLFERLEAFVDRGPRAFIMQAFCEVAAMRVEKGEEALEAAFEGDDRKMAEALKSAFVSYHVGIREDALKTMADLVNNHQELPVLALLLGNMLKGTGNLPLARKCWSMAVHRDRTGGAVAAAAKLQLQRTARPAPPSQRSAES